MSVGELTCERCGLRGESILDPWVLVGSGCAFVCPPCSTPEEALRSVESMRCSAEWNRSRGKGAPTRWALLERQADEIERLALAAQAEAAALDAALASAPSSSPSPTPTECRGLMEGRR